MHKGPLMKKIAIFALVCVTFFSGYAADTYRDVTFQNKGKTVVIVNYFGRSGKATCQVLPGASVTCNVDWTNPGFSVTDPLKIFEKPLERNKVCNGTLNVTPSKEAQTISFTASIMNCLQQRTP